MRVSTLDRARKVAPNRKSIVTTPRSNRPFSPSETYGAFVEFTVSTEPNLDFVVDLFKSLLGLQRQAARTIPSQYRKRVLLITKMSTTVPRIGTMGWRYFPDNDLSFDESKKHNPLLFTEVNR